MNIVHCTAATSGGAAALGNRNFETTFCFARAQADCRIVCGACAHEVIVSGQELVRVFLLPVTIERAERRLRCSACGEKRGRMIPVPATRPAALRRS